MTTVQHDCSKFHLAIDCVAIEMHNSQSDDIHSSE